MLDSLMETEVYQHPDLISANLPDILDSSSKTRSRSSRHEQPTNEEIPVPPNPSRQKQRKRKSVTHSCSRMSSELNNVNAWSAHRTAIISRDYTTESLLASVSESGSSVDLTTGGLVPEFNPPCVALIIDEPEKAYVQYMQARRVYDVIPVNTKFVVLDTNLNVRKAFYALIYNGVRSALLWSSADEQFCGLLTVTDFINILIHTYNNAPDGKVENIEDQLIREWRELLSRQNKLKPLLYVTVNDTLLHATKKLLDARFHRIPIFDETGGSALHFLTHKRILRYLYLVIDKLPMPSFMSSSVRSLNVGTYDDVLTVHQHTPLIECLHRLTSRNLSALPVLDQSGVVVDIYARFDAITVAAEGTYSMLDRPVCEMLARRKKFKWYKGVVTCLETDSLKVIIDKLYSSEVHGLVVVNEERKLRGVITLFDVLKFIILDQMDA